MPARHALQVPGATPRVGHATAALWSSLSPRAPPPPRPPLVDKMGRGVLLRVFCLVCIAGCCWPDVAGADGRDPHWAAESIIVSEDGGSAGEGSTDVVELQVERGLDDTASTMLVISYATRSATAWDGRDFIGSSATVALAAGQRSAAVVVELADGALEAIPQGSSRAFDVLLLAGADGEADEATLLSTATVTLQGAGSRCAQRPADRPFASVDCYEPEETGVAVPRCVVSCDDGYGLTAAVGMLDCNGGSWADDGELLCWPNSQRSEEILAVYGSVALAPPVTQARVVGGMLPLWRRAVAQAVTLATPSDVSYDEAQVVVDAVRNASASAVAVVAPPGTGDADLVLLLPTRVVAAGPELKLLLAELPTLSALVYRALVHDVGLGSGVVKGVHLWVEPESEGPSNTMVIVVLVLAPVCGVGVVLLTQIAHRHFLGRKARRTDGAGGDAGKGGSKAPNMQDVGRNGSESMVAWTTPAPVQH